MELKKNQIPTKSLTSWISELRQLENQGLEEKRDFVTNSWSTLNKQERLMTDIMAHAVEAIEKKLEGTVFDGSAKFEIEGQGSVIIDASGVRVSDDETEVTLSANLETFQEMLEGDLVGKSVHSQAHCRKYFVLIRRFGLRPENKAMHQSLSELLALLKKLTNKSIFLFVFLILL